MQGALGEFVDRSTALVESSPQMDEQNTRTKLVDPFVRDVLGWDLYSEDVALEYSVQMGSTKKKADYALLIEGVPSVFVEAKGCDTSITGSTHAEQLRSYMKQEWVDWGLLTNGKRFELYRLRKSADDPSVRRIGRSSLADLGANEWMVNALTKESIESGAADTIYRNVERRQRAVASLSEGKEELANRIRKLVVETAGEVASQPAESHAKGFIDELIADLENGQQGSEIAEMEDIEPEEQTDPASGKPSASTSVESTGRGSDQYHATVIVDGERVAFYSDDQSDLMRDVTGYLVANHGLVRNLPQFPYVPGRKTAILNDEPVSTDGSEMRSFRDLDQGHFVYTSLNKESKQRYLRRFSDFCGVEIEFDGW
ncbi:type I restriction endonuclease [Natronorarus salvus]|uniref:type I restriction endonuclease n=1 Tax=Natronorarus salvus TaxID=3117733 RepID=UPI002F26AC21